MRNTTLCYIQHEDKILMLHRTKKEIDENKNKWIGIGGKFLEDESPEDCLCREVLEETGLILDRYRYRGIITFISDEWGSQLMHLFTADVFHGKLQVCNEGELAWISKTDIPNLELWEGDRLFFDLLQEDLPFFTLKLVYAGDMLVHHETHRYITCPAD